MQRVAINPAIMEALAADITDNLVQLGGAVEQMAAPDGSGNYNIAVVEAAMAQLHLRLRVLRHWDPTVALYLVLQGRHYNSLTRLGGHPLPSTPSRTYVLYFPDFFKVFYMKHYILGLPPSVVLPGYFERVDINIFFNTYTYKTFWQSILQQYRQRCAGHAIKNLMQREAVTADIMEALAADVTEHLVQLGGEVEQMAALPSWRRPWCSFTSVCGSYNGTIRPLPRPRGRSLHLPGSPGWPPLAFR